MTYLELKEKQQAEINTFPLGFAFSNKQFAEMITPCQEAFVALLRRAKWGLTENDTDKIYGFGNTSGFYLRTDAKALQDMVARHENECNQVIAEAIYGIGYVYECSDMNLLITCIT